MRRLLFVAAVFIALAMTAISFAAGRQLQNVPATQASTLPTAAPVTVVVPDVRKEAFVFAKEQLQDAGFAWKVSGATAGYPANVVLSQKPAPGTKLVDTGAPLITLTLERNKQYAPSGEPENTSPYSPTATRLAS
jgi:beta-lactam-binding protein with PASTA domain